MTILNDLGQKSRLKFAKMSPPLERAQENVPNQAIFILFAC